MTPSLTFHFFILGNTLRNCCSDSCINLSTAAMFTVAHETSFHYLWLVNFSVLVCVPPLTHTVVAQAAVRGAWRSEHLAGEAVLELHHLLVDDDLLGAGRRPIAAVSSVVYTGEENSQKKQQDTDH